jgi:hypothetical protein
VIVTVIGVPAQPLAEGVIVYVAVPGVEPELVKVCAMVDPDPAVAPVMPDDCVTVQENVVPATLLVKLMLGAVPEQIV